MNNQEISCHTDLQLHIMQLKAAKYRQEEELKLTFMKLAYTINPVSIVKKSLHEMTMDKEIKAGLVNVGLNLGTNYIIGRMLGRQNSIKGFLSAMLVKKISALLVNHNSSKVISGISRLMHRNPKKEIYRQKV